MQAAGIKLIYLPPYSPDLNPIEHYWHKIKNSIRKLMRNSKLLLENAMEQTLKETSIFSGHSYTIFSNHFRQKIASLENCLSILMTHYSHLIHDE